MSRARPTLPSFSAAVSLCAAAAFLLCAASPSAATAAPALDFLPQLGLPAADVNMVGAAPGEAPGSQEAPYWATGSIGSVPASVNGAQVKEAAVLLRHAEGSGWQVVPVVGAHGEGLPFTGAPSVSYYGGLVLLGSEVVAKATVQTILTRDRGGPFAPVPPPPAGGAGAVLQAGESLYPTAAQGSPHFTAIDEPAHTGALIVPGGLSATDPGVLHYDGTQWAREQICTTYTRNSGGEVESCAVPAGGLKVLEIAASAPLNAWLLASSSSESLMLFKRTLPASGSGPPVWAQSQPASWAPSGDSVFARTGGQMLTVTSQGVWVDATLTTPAVQNADLSLLLDAGSPSTVLGTWCYPQVACGQGSLGAPLPQEYRSFAWPGGAPGDLGTRIVAGLEDGALLRFEGGGDFQYVVGGGGQASAQAAFASPTEGFISAAAGAGGDSAQVEHVAGSTPPSLKSWPLPFRRPLTAIAPQPGTAPGDPSAQALAVGDQGQIARYMPGQGWTPEFLYNAAGEVQAPRLRGVAWPEANRAYAVGDGGAMWVWRSETNLWEPDPAEPLGLHANLMSIAFSSLDPAVGYAVGKQGTLLAYDKTWTQQAPPPGLEAANFTSVAFAGGEALATYRMVDAAGAEIGGLIVNEGTGWHVEEQAQALLAGLPNAAASVLSKVAGLPDGGAVAAGPGVVIERDSASAPWQFSPEPLPEAQNIAALAAVEEGSQVRALVSIDLEGVSNPNSETNFIRSIDNPPAAGAGEPSVLIGPDPLPVSGYLVRQSAAGWEDLEQRAYPFVPSDVNSDLPNWPDAVLALDVGPSGQGWAVGGQTGGLVEQSPLQGAQLVSQSASALRLPLGSGPQPPQSEGAAISTPGGEATFALGGDAQCAGPCADFANEELGPDAWLSGAVSRAAQISGLHGFLYTGARMAEGAARSLSADAFDRELEAYRRDLSAAGGLHVYAAASPSDVDRTGGLGSFDSVLEPDAPAGLHLPGTGAPPLGSAAYAIESSGAGGTVCVIVIDYSAAALPAGELAWLAEQLQVAKSRGMPAIVMGNADIVEAGVPSYPLDAVELQRTLLVGGASAYLFESPGENRVEQIGSGANAIPAFGSGTLGYVPSPPIPEEFLGASGFLLVSVDAAQRNPSTNRAPLTTTLVPNISQLALDATDGTLLRRSQVALFQGLARRAAGGLELTGGANKTGTAPNPYVPIPETCIGARCAQFVAPSYTFSSSRPDFGGFVEQEPSNPNPRAVLQGANGKPIPDEPRNSKGELNPDGRFDENANGEPINEKGEVVPRSQSGTFCAYNAGTTIVSITTGGLTYREPVTVQAGSVEQPCGTVPLINPPPAVGKNPAPVTPPPPATLPAASSPVPLSVPAPPPPPVPLPAPVPPQAHPPTPPPSPPLLLKPLPAVPLAAAVLPPPPPLARPIPPSGAATVSVFQVAVAEKREDEEAVESARNSMAVYDPSDPRLPPAVPLALIVLAAGAGAAIRRAGRSRRPRHTPALARAQWRDRTR